MEDNELSQNQILLFWENLGKFWLSKKFDKMQLIYGVHWCFFNLLLCIVVCLFVGEGVGFRWKRGEYFIPFGFSFKVVFVLSTKSESKPDCYAGLKNKCQWAHVHWGTCSPEILSVQQLAEALQKTDCSQIWQSFESLCMSTTVLRSRVTERSLAVWKQMSSHSSSLPSCWT